MQGPGPDVCTEKILLCILLPRLNQDVPVHVHVHTPVSCILPGLLGSPGKAM